MLSSWNKDIFIIIIKLSAKTIEIRKERQTKEQEI